MSDNKNSADEGSHAIEFASEKKKKAQDRYRELVLEKWDEFDRSDKRKISDRKADVHFKAKEQL